MLGHMKTSDRVLVILYELQMKGKQKAYLAPTTSQVLCLVVYPCLYIHARLSIYLAVYA